MESKEREPSEIGKNISGRDVYTFAAQYLDTGAGLF
jgi:hypothetical protein